MYYVVDKHMCFVCYQVADMPTPRVSSVRQPCAGCDADLGIEEIAYRTAQNLYSLHRSRRTSCVRYFSFSACPSRRIASERLGQIGSI